MTIREIADAAGIDRTTVYRTARKLFPELFENGKQTIFDQDQATRIIESVRKKNVVYVPVQDAKQSAQLPAGAQMNAMIRMYGPRGAGDRLDSLMGWNHPTPPRPEIPESTGPILSTEKARKRFEAIRRDLEARAERDRRDDEMQGRLELN